RETKMRKNTLVLALIVLFVVSINFAAGEGADVDLNVTVVGPPAADVGGPYSGYSGRRIYFDGSGSTDADGTIVAYDWDFGDGETGLGIKPNHTYSLTGTYTVNLTVTDNDGLTDWDNTTVEVTRKYTSYPAVINKLPVAEAGSNQTADVGQFVEFSGINSTDPDGYLISWTWDFSTSTGYGLFSSSLG
ncbi:unnamed protein product, partial [marine sediment metagenome]